MPPKISVVIPTRNRPGKLIRTIGSLQVQSLPREAYEVIIVDDGSEPPVNFGRGPGSAHTRLLRLTHGERSDARNRGAEAARGELLAFVDDDIIVSASFLEAHVEAHSEWPGVLAVGAISLPDSALATPFGRFRAKLELGGIPTARGIVTRPSFCTAQNMSLSCQRFAEVGGFDRQLVSGEDQDLGMRHVAKGGRLAFIPEAKAIHDDDNLEMRSYCRRIEWGAEQMIPFIQKHPYLPDNLLRASVNGPAQWGQDPAIRLFKKAAKHTLSRAPVLEALFTVTSIVQRFAPRGRALPSLYGLLVGVHLQRGFRRGWTEAGIPRS